MVNGLPLPLFTPPCRRTSCALLCGGEALAPAQARHDTTCCAYRNAFCTLALELRRAFLAAPLIGHAPTCVSCLPLGYPFFARWAQNFLAKPAFLSQVSVMDLRFFW